MSIPGPHHMGYVVEDMEAAAAHAARTLGAGPFFHMAHLQFDEATFAGAPATYDHSAAFGAWGPILLELNVVHGAEPAGLLDALGGVGVGHVGWLVDDLDAETARLEADGLELFHTGRTGPASARWFSGAGVLGHHVEVLLERPPILGFYAMVREAATGWDGGDVLRAMG